MKLKVFDIVVAEGTEVELALYTHVFLESMRLKAEQDRKKNEAGNLADFINMTFEEIMKREREEEE